jgi:dienelactone hydrolase
MRKLTHTLARPLACLALLLACGAALNVKAQTPDPGAAGPLAVTREEYNYGDLAFTPTGFPSAVELKASVHYPTGLAAGPYPLVVFMHGRHVTCYRNTTTALRWPCRSTETVIPSYQGYDYVAQNLASHGYVVISVSANGINAYDNNVTDLGMQARAELIQRHLQQWNTFNTAGAAPFGTKFVGKVDLQRVGTMGHSRGGEGVVKHFAHNKSLGSPYGVKAVFPLAPVNFNRTVANNVPVSVVLPYCDGDVNDNQGVHFYDDARYNVAGDAAPKHTIQVMGGNHNYFNTVWTPGMFPAGTGDDWTYTSGGSADAQCGTGTGNHRLTAVKQRGVGLAYISAVMRAYVGGESQFLPYLTGEVAPPPSAQTTELHVSYHAPDTAAARRDVNRLLTASNLTTNTLGGASAQTGLTPHDLCGGASPQPQHCLASTQSTARQPHTTVSARATTVRGLSQLRTGWSAITANYRNDLPLGARDVSGFRWLTFRVSVNFADTRNPSGIPQNFTVVLTDGAGATSALAVANYSGALFYPPGSVGPVPKVLLNTARIPVSAFSGVNLSDIRSVQFKFDQSPSGALLISDVAFSSPPVP